MTVGLTPFAVTGAVPLHAWSGTLSVDLALREPFSPGEALRAGEEAVKLLMLGVDRQLFTPPDVQRPASASILFTSRAGDGPRSTFVIDVRDFALTSLLVLTSLLAQTHFAGDSLEGVDFVADSLSPNVPIDEVFSLRERLRTLNVPSQTGFPIIRSVDAPITNASFRFRDAVGAESATAKAEALDVWGHIAHLGGYLLDFEEQESFTTQFGDTAHLTPTMIDHVWSPFEGWDGALQPLINLARAWERAGDRLVSLELS